MPDTFLHHVACDLRQRFGTNFHDVAIVFPNKRAGLFLEPSLLQGIDTAIWSPRYLTISELFHLLSPLHSADELLLLAKLHQCYAQCTDTEETFDAFLSWGQVLMADFDDIDKHLADAEAVFSNVSNLHELDSVAYLNEEQKQRIADFFSDFSENQESRLQQRFLHVWCQLGTVYERFTSQLIDEGIGYEGLLQRQTIDHDNDGQGIAGKLQSIARHFVFVGFNLLQPVERKLLQIVGQHCGTLFYWDYDVYYLNNGHEAGESIRENMQLFGNALNDAAQEVYDNFRREKDITLISAPSENMLARYATQWLTQEVANSLTPFPPNTAIVLCNESLLPAVVHALPTHMVDSNITIGYPLAETSIASLLQNLLLYYHHGTTRNQQRLRLKYVLPLLAHPLTQLAAETATTLLTTLQEEYGFFPPHEAVTANDEVLTTIFTLPQQQSNETEQLLALSAWLLTIVETIARRIGNMPQAEPLNNEALFKAHSLLTRLDNLVASGAVTISIYTYEQVLRKLIAQTSIPFSGEPAIGLQVMGMLETRNLDFDNILLLSCQDQNLPKGGNDISYIPYLLRKAFALTTHEHKESMQSYYFYRLLQRAKKVTLAYCDAATGMSNGEMSRFILQLLTESPHRLRLLTLTNNVALEPFLPADVEKTPAITQLLAKCDNFSPTGINRYLDCPRRFFYEYVAGIRQPDDTDEDNIDQRIFGTLFHEVMETLYHPFLERHHPVTREYLDRLQNNPHIIDDAIDDAISKELGGSRHKAHKEAMTYSGTLLIIRKVLRQYTCQLLHTDSLHAPFYILGLEQQVAMPLTLPAGCTPKSVHLKGVIDRLDAHIDANGQIHLRVVDYKTGRPQQKNDCNIADLFDHEKDGHIKGYLLQTCIYSMMVQHCLSNGTLPLGTLLPGTTPEQQRNATIQPALLFIRQFNEENSNPILHINKQPVTDIKQHVDELKEGLSQLFAEMFDATKPYRARPDDKQCRNCHCYALCNFSKEKARPASPTTHSLNDADAREEQ